MMYIMCILFPLLAIGCCLWIFVAIISYIVDLHRDIRTAKKAGPQ